MTVDLQRLINVIPNRGVDIPWDLLVEQVRGTTGRRPAWNLSPTYQRGPVWSRAQQMNYIGHVLTGGVSPPIYCQRHDSPKHTSTAKWYDLPVEVLDGRQRLQAVLDFIEGQIPARVLDGTEHRDLWYKDFDARERRAHTMSTSVVFMDISFKERLTLYLRLNNGGTPHSAEDLQKVREMLKDLP